MESIQINAIKAMIQRGLSELEIAAKLNSLGEKNTAHIHGEWDAQDIQSIVASYNLKKYDLINKPIDLSLKQSDGSKFFCVAGGVIALIGGVSLAFLKAAGENNLLEAIANGVGWYCIGKGIFMISSTFKFKN